MLYWILNSGRLLTIERVWGLDIMVMNIAYCAKWRKKQYCICVINATSSLKVGRKYQCSLTSDKRIHLKLGCIRMNGETKWKQCGHGRFGRKETAASSIIIPMTCTKHFNIINVDQYWGQMILGNGWFALCGLRPAEIF